MLDGTPPQEKLYRHLHVLNACEQSCIMMIMGGSKMFKTEYDLKAIMYPAYDTPHQLCNIRGNENIQHPRMGLMQLATHPMWDYVRGRLRKQAAFTHSIENSVILDESRHVCTNLMTYTHLYDLITTYS